MSRYQSALLRANLDTSRPNTRPTCPRATSAVSRAKPDRQTEVLVDDDNPIGRPPKLTGLMRQGVLSIGRLAVVLNLGGAGLAQIDDGHAGKMTGGDLLDVTHHLSPALSWPRASAR